MATLVELETALVNADKAGDADAARKLAALITVARQDKANKIPGAHVPGTVETPKEPGILDKAVGAGEAALTMATGATGGALGTAAGALSGIITSARNGTYGTQQGVKTAEEAAMAGAQDYTYAPRTSEGQRYASAIGEALQNLIPFTGIGGEVGAITQAAKPAIAQGVQALQQGGAKAAAAVAESAPVSAARGAVARFAATSPDTPTPGTFGSAGAAGTDIGTMRQARADQLPVPIKLTKGQRERTFEDQRFERETAKDPESGAPLRQRFEEQNSQILKNFDAWLDQTGAEAPSLRDTGLIVDKAIKAKASAAKAATKEAYKKANESAESSVIADPGKVVTVGNGEDALQTSLIDYLNSKPTGLKTTSLTDHAKQYAVRIGVAEKADDGSLIPKPASIKTMEELRKEISQATGYDPVEIRDSTILKKLIDAQTEELVGPLYKKARTLRARYANEFENRAVIADIMGNKRGMNDRKVAYEDVHRRAIIDGSLDDVRMVRATLQRQGEEGKQAWRELQGQTLAHIKDAAVKNVGMDSQGNPTVSAAGLDRVVKSLDKDGKLDFIFGKQGAQQLRDINDIAKDVLTVPANAVNSSNTASVLLTALDTIATFGTTGVPIPALQALKALHKSVKQRKVKQRVQEALK